MVFKNVSNSSGGLVHILARRHFIYIKQFLLYKIIIIIINVTNVCSLLVNNFFRDVYFRLLKFQSVPWAVGNENYCNIHII